jgi:class 3 adenylate cyclase
MSNCELTIHSNPDAQAWAKYFIHKKEEKNWQIEDIDESLMTAWFANAMMAMHDHLGSQRTWVGLTDEEVYEIYGSVQEEVNEHWERGGTTMMFPTTLYKAIEAKLKELNL